MSNLKKDLIGVQYNTHWIILTKDQYEFIVELIKTTKSSSETSDEVVWIRLTRTFLNLPLLESKLVVKAIMEEIESEKPPKNFIPF